jgi:endonuclease/exonuclease/phosphatase family metal-dependent hydrolase
MNLNRNASLVTAVICLFAAGIVNRPLVTFAADSTNAAQLCVASYNVRYASSTPPNSWPERRPLVNEVIRGINPDVLGTQEGVLNQLKDMAADLPDYGWIGTGRDGGDKGEFMAVFYRKARLEPLATNHFWLSDTPEIPGSTTWGNSNRRMVTWIRFRDHATGKEFYFFNTHFDHQVQTAREKSAELVRSRIADLPGNLPVILTGDFNAAAQDNPAYDILTKDGFFEDSWIKAGTRQGEGIATFNSFKAISTNGVRIDWILTRGNVAVDAAAIVSLKPKDQWASDHFPVVAHIAFK